MHLTDTNTRKMLLKAAEEHGFKIEKQSFSTFRFIDDSSLSAGTAGSDSGGGEEGGGCSEDISGGATELGLGAGGGKKRQAVQGEEEIAEVRSSGGDLACCPPRFQVSHAFTCMEMAQLILSFVRKEFRAVYFYKVLLGPWRDTSILICCIYAAMPAVLPIFTRITAFGLDGWAALCLYGEAAEGQQELALDRRNSRVYGLAIFAVDVWEIYVLFCFLVTGVCIVSERLSAVPYHERDEHVHHPTASPWIAREICIRPAGSTSLRRGGQTTHRRQRSEQLPPLVRTVQGRWCSISATLFRFG
jgi:hypothetical protein